MLLGAVLFSVGLCGPAQGQPGRTLLRKDSRFVNSPGPQQFPDAAAIILYDDIGFELKSDASTTYHEYDVVKILTSEGIEPHQTLVRVYRRGHGEVTLHEARVIGPDQAVHDVNPDAVVDAPLLPKSKVYADYRRFELEFPSLAPGSVLEYRLTTSRKPSYRNAWWATSYVQNPEPLLVSIFTVKSPLGTDVQWAAPGLVPSRPTRSEADQSQVLRWQVSDQAALRTEPAMPEAESLLRRVDLSSFKSWNELGDWFYSDWRDKAGGGPRLGMITSGLIPTAATPMARAQAILDWVVASKKQVDLSYEQFLPNKVSELIDEPVLSYMDTCILVSAMLEFAGFRTQPVLAFTEPTEEVARLLPQPTQVGRVLLYLPDVGGRPCWFDPAHPGQLISGPPGGFQGRAALFLGPEGPRLADASVDAFDVNRDETKIEARVDEQGSAELAISKQQFGESATFLREAVRALASSDRSRRDTILRSLFAAIAQSYSPLAQVHERYFPDKEPAGPGFPLGMTLIVPDYVAVEGNKRQVSIPIQLDQRIASLASSPADREHPLQFDHPFRDDSQVHLMLPEGSKILSMPGSVQVDNDYVSFLLTSRQEGREAWFYSRLVVKRPWIPVQDYAQVLAVAREVSQVANTPLVYETTPSPKSEDEEGE